MPQEAQNKNHSNRLNLLKAVKTPLGFFVLIVLVVESILGVIAISTSGENQLVIYGMLAIIVILIAIVSFFAYKKPESLLRTIESYTGSESDSIQKFCERISGNWWEKITPDKPISISFVKIWPDPATLSVKLNGSAFNNNGELAAFWESVATCIKLNENKIFYYWRGWHPSRPNEPYEGFGEISFQLSSQSSDSGYGFFSDTNLTDMKSTTRKSIELRRSSKRESEVMAKSDKKSVSEMALKKLDGFTE